jgi:hypothetical protein
MEQTIADRSPPGARQQSWNSVTLKNGIFWDVRPVALSTTDVSEELSASFIRMTRIGELGTTLAVASNRRTLRRNTKARFEVFTAATMKNGVFWDVTPCGFCKSRGFGGT